MPTLAELHHHLFGVGFEGAHDALADARAAARCHARLAAHGALSLPAPAEPPPPTPEQAEALAALNAFLASARSAFVLLGAAGTGKTTLLQHLAARADALGRPVHLLAPTGRAARVAAARTGRTARTLHSHLYTYERLETTDADDPEAAVSLRFGLRKPDEAPATVFIVDEASMVSDSRDEAETLLAFGSGRLLSDLIAYAGLSDRSRGHQVVFVGDPAQLPPVGSPRSPALVPAYLAERHGLDAEAFELRHVMRQKQGSGILASAHRIRRGIEAGDFAALCLDEDAADVAAVAPEEAVPAYLDAVRAGGFDAAILIAPTNRAASALNAQVRTAYFGRVPLLVPGDRLIVVQNNLLHDLYNGDFVEVVGVSERAEQRRPLKDVTLSWRELTVRQVGTGLQRTTLILDGLVASETGNLTPREAQALIVDFRQRHPHLKPKMKAFEEAMRSDPYLHALRVRHGYALTCHKAQGGEWPTAIVAFDGRAAGWDNESYFRWTYTAITRASTRLVAVWPPRYTLTSDVGWMGGEVARSAPRPVGEGGAMTWLAPAGIAVTATQEMPYRNRVTVTRDGLVGRIDVVYDGKGIVKSVGPLGSGPGQELAVEAAALLLPMVGLALHAAAVEAPDADAPSPDWFADTPHLAVLYDRFRAALDGTDICIEAVAHHAWMERYSFRRGLERAQIDVYYNGKGRFTRARPVQPGALATEIQVRWNSL